jgi:hypothetical protein
MHCIRMTHDGEWSDPVWHIGLQGWLAVLVIAVSLVGGPLWAAEEEVNNGQDPTKPLTRLDFRYQYQNLPPDDYDNAHIFTPRADKPFVLAPGWSLATRIDLPLFITDAVSPDNPGGHLWSASGTCSCRDSSSTRRVNGSPWPGGADDLPDGQPGQHGGWQVPSRAHARRPLQPARDHPRVLGRVPPPV